MRDFIIRLLGGVTKLDFLRATNILKEGINELKKKSLRVGDAVYLQDERFEFNEVYYLLEPYNLLNCWYVSKNPLDTRRQCLKNGIRFDNISRFPPNLCKTCNRPLNEN